MMQKIGAACAVVMTSAYAQEDMGDYQPLVEYPDASQEENWNSRPQENWNRGGRAYGGAQQYGRQSYGGHSSGYGGETSYGGSQSYGRVATKQAHTGHIGHGVGSHGHSGHGHAGHGHAVARPISRNVAHFSEALGAPKASYANVHTPRGHYDHAPQQASGFRWGRRSTYRPRDVKAFNVDLVDDYWRNAHKPKETIVATCEFDFIGYSESTGSLTLRQEAGDLTSIIGEFEGVGSGQHAMKIHEWGDLEHGCSAIGNVFNPFGAKQGQSHEDMMDRRVGDLENLQGRWSTDAEYKSRDAEVMLSGPNSVIGRAMAVYERGDDHDMTEHPGIEGREERVRKGMGEPIACCVIGLAKGEKPKPAPIQKQDVNPKKPDNFRAKATAPHSSHARPAHAHAHSQGHVQHRQHDIPVRRAPQGYGYGIQQRQYVQPRW